MTATMEITGNELHFFTPGTVVQVTRIATVHDVASSLNTKYFNFFSPFDADHYIPFFSVDGGGTDPMIPGTTSVEVDITAGSSANDVATALSDTMNGALNVLASAVGNVVTVLNGQPGAPAYGSSTDAFDGAAPTGFAITTPTQGASISSSSPGIPGDMRYDANFLYVCVATNSWKRIALLAF